MSDPWRSLFPPVEDFTFSLLPHNKYSRIYLFFLSQPDLSYLAKATIESLVFSDHHPVTLALLLKIWYTKLWRLDALLLRDLLDSLRLQSYLQEFFSLNDTADTSPIIQWEAHKSAIKGELLALAENRKRIHQQTVLTYWHICVHWNGHTNNSDKGNIPTIHRFLPRTFGWAIGCCLTKSSSMKLLLMTSLSETASFNFLFYKKCYSGLPVLLTDSVWHPTGREVA